MSAQAPFLLGEDPEAFPDPELALTEPNGLLAIGGDLRPERLLAAYRLGIFPWYEKPPILWWSPNPRTVLLLKDLKISTSLKKTLRSLRFDVRVDENFPEVLRQCAAPRQHQHKIITDTWLTPEMQAAYTELFTLGYAHSIETYANGKLVGGLYGVCLGSTFFGESMFSRESDASKVALIYLANHLTQWGFEFIDCQVPSEHLFSLGATFLPRTLFLIKVATHNRVPTRLGKWDFT